MKEKDILNLIFEMRYHYHEYERKKDILDFLNVNVDNIKLNDSERNLLDEYYIKKNNLKQIAKDSGLSYGYVRHKIINVRKKILQQLEDIDDMPLTSKKNNSKEDAENPNQK